MGLFAQTYKSLWQQVEKAQERDLPQTAMKHLADIVQKARSERAYGQLLKSELLYARLQGEVAPDSLLPAVQRLEQCEAAASDIALKAVYDAVLSSVYGSNRQLADDWQERSAAYSRCALARPDVLAQTTTAGYEPFVVRGADSEVFGHDLLSVIGSELDAWQLLSDYYRQAGNRPAACLAAVHTVKTIADADALLATYGDLPEAGEVALQRLSLMPHGPEHAAEHYAFLTQALSRWGTWKRASQLRNELAQLQLPLFEVSVAESVSEVDKPQQVHFSALRHLHSVTLRIYRTQLAGDTRLNPMDSDDLRQIRQGMQELPALAQTKTFGPHPDYEVFEDSLQLAGLQPGVYLLEWSSEPATQVVRELYFVSGLRLLMQSLPDNTTRYVVVDATTGQPVSGATIRLELRNAMRLLTTDRHGEALYKADGNDRRSLAYVYTASDKALPAVSSYGRYSYYERSNANEHTHIFTDRSIYRPGQTVHAMAIVWKELSAVDNTAVADRTLTFELRDANYKVVGEQQATTDRYGKCAVQFTLPKGLLNGYFTIRANKADVGFRVEEYKRPAFQVEFADYEAAYQRGDTVRAQGRAVTYAGVPVQGAKVHYTVRRRVAYWWMACSRYWSSGAIGRLAQETIVNEGDAVTADDGTFTADMPLVVPDSKATMFYHFVVEADVTDVAGETHSGTLSLPLGTKPTVLTSDLPEQVRSDRQSPVTFSRRNAAGKEIAGTVRYRVDGGKWQECAANVPCTVLPAKCPSGSHRLEAVCEQDTLDVPFVVFALGDKVPATTTDDWYYVSDYQFPADGTPVTVQVGSSDADMHIVYGLFAGNTLIESGAVAKSRALINRQFTYKEEYGNGLLIAYAWVKNGVCHQHQSFLRRPMPDKQLKLTWETFRDRLVPGQQEEWRLKVAQPDGTAADASLMAVLYDKSLDALYPHSWTFRPVSTLPQPHTFWYWRTWNSIYRMALQPFREAAVPVLQYSSFDSSVYPYYNRHDIYIRGTRARIGSMAVTASNGAVELLKAKEVIADAVAPVAAMAEQEEMVVGYGVKGDEGKPSDTSEEVQLRENLNETAFCYPALTTDKDGTVVLKFTLPESLTTWRFMGVAHTADMLFGSIDAEAVAKKDVMIQPSMPRFIRVGDEARLSARIFNTSAKAVSGHARLQLLDAATERVVCEQTVPFAVEAGKTASATFAVDGATLQESLLICRVSAYGDGFSDGEQHYLPVLSDREYVTKTIPYTQHEPGVKTIDLSALFPQETTRHKLTVEYTNNPVWLMVQALPVVGQPREHSAIDQAAAYYSNLLARTLLAQSPQAKGVFEQWKREQGSETTLASQLAKDESLKDLVLAETPWVNAADRESEQRQRLADFFDENGIGIRLQTAVEKLRKLQNGDGSFSWYPGMEGSTGITVAVGEMLVRLNRMAGRQEDTADLQDKAFDYIGRQMTDLVARMKKDEKKGVRPVFPSFTALRWLYLCAIDGRRLAADVKAANDYLIGLLRKDIKRQSIYEKALTAVVLAHHQDRRAAADYVKSLKEYTVYTDEMGRYYDTPRAGYSWYDYRIPTEVAAIEAIQLVTPADGQTVDEMRRWLLQEKRTQAWDTPISSVNALYAFLNATPHSQRENGRSHLLTTNAPATVLSVDGKPLDAPATAGIGYVKAVVDGAAASAPRTFTAAKTSEGMSWGAVYAQFMQKTSAVESAQSGITVKCELLDAKSRQPIGQPADRYHVGDRITVRITIETTRDLDFVEVVDRRAACMEPVHQLSGYRNGAYVSPKDYATCYFYGGLAKGKHIIETEYYIDRAGQYETGTCTVGCAYAPEYRATAPSLTITVKE